MDEKDMKAMKRVLGKLSALRNTLTKREKDMLDALVGAIPAEAEVKGHGFMPLPAVQTQPAVPGEPAVPSNLAVSPAVPALGQVAVNSKGKYQLKEQIPTGV